MAFLLAQGQLQTSGGRYESWRGNFIYSSTMIQHIAHLGTYWSGDKYLRNSGYSSALWDSNYPGALKTLTHVVDQTAEMEGMGNLHAMAQLMRTFALHRLTDVYGDVPYTQAGRGLNDEANWFPAYDPQQDIYNMLVTEIRAARDELSASGLNVGVQDVMFQGDVARWQRWANSQLLRVGMRMVNVDPGTAQSVVEEAANHPAGVIESNDQNAGIYHVAGVGINRNSNSEVWFPGNGGENGNARLSNTFVTWMQANNDPRLLLIGGGLGDPLDPTTWNTDYASQRGMPNGFDSQTIIQRAIDDGVIASEDDFTTDLYTFVNPLIWNLEDPMFFQQAGEVHLILAEAALMGWNVPGTALEHFEAGVTAAIQNWENYDASLAVDQAVIDAYLAGLNFAGAANQAELIGEQYWAATFWNNEYESWANWRRSGIPALTPTNYNGNVTGGTIPRRLEYSQGEVGGNPDNYAAAIARQGEDLFTTRIWWDAN